MFDPRTRVMSVPKRFADHVGGAVETGEREVSSRIGGGDRRKAVRERWLPHVLDGHIGAGFGCRLMLTVMYFRMTEKGYVSVPRDRPGRHARRAPVADHQVDEGSHRGRPTAESRRRLPRSDSLVRRRHPKRKGDPKLVTFTERKGDQFDSTFECQNWSPFIWTKRTRR